MLSVACCVSACCLLHTQCNRSCMLHATSAIRLQLREAAEREVNLMRHCCHPHIVRFLGVHWHDDSAEIVMEYASGGSIAELLKVFGPFVETLCRLYIRQLLDAVSYLHSQSIVHRDLKGSNILVDNAGLIKLADLGCACGLGECSGAVGTTVFMAPEVARGGAYDCKADVWSIGCVLFEMLSARPPWHNRFSNDHTAIYHIARAKQLPLADLDPLRVSERCVDLIRKCCTQQPHSRPDVKSLGMHEFIRSEIVEHR